jgi:hypothetical protein
MVLRFATEDVFERVANQRRDRFEVGDSGEQEPMSVARRDE